MSDHVANLIKIAGSLDSLEYSDLTPIRAARIELQIASFRLMSYSTFSGNNDYDHIAKKAGIELLNLLEKVSSDPETSGIGPGFIRHYVYAKYVSRSDRSNAVEQWMGSPSDIEHVWPFDVLFHMLTVRSWRMFFWFEK